MCALDTRLRGWVLAAAVAGVVGLGASAPRAETVLRLIVDADLTVLDPVYNSSVIASNHGYMVYDQLFALDSKGVPQPQMVDSYERSADGLVWTFRLRDGLRFSDGSPVEAADAVASIKRWAARQAAGRSMMTRVQELVATGPDSFEFRFSEPYAPLLEALGGPGQPLFVMREEEALTGVDEPIPEVIGSGPFLFVAEEWRPGSKLVYRKNPDYVPRAEPADGLAGGRVAKVDRVEWLYLPDPTTAVQALIRGEGDLIEAAPTDLMPILEAAPEVELKVIDRIGTQAMLRPNHLHPPFDDPRARQALLYLVGDQADMLAAMVGRPELEVACWSVFVCNTPLASEAGVRDWAKGNREANLAKARRLFEAAGYDGSPVVMLDPTDRASYHKAMLVVQRSLSEIGVNTELQAMDWSTVLARRKVKESPAESRGGWNLVSTGGNSVIISSPLANPWVPTPCDGENWYGWACDEELEAMRLQFITAEGAEREDLLRRYQERFYETVPYVILGQYQVPIAHRTNVTGIIEAPRLVMWNIEKH